MAQQFAKDQSQGYNNYIKKVAIVGATGTIGTYIVNALLATNKHSITAITRKGSKSTPPKGVTAAPIDYDEPSTIVDALKGHDILIITLSVFAPKDTHDKLAKAAHDAGVPWILPNSFGIGTNSKGAHEALLAGAQVKQQEYIQSLSTPEKPISWVAVASGFWYEFSIAGSPDRFGFDISNGKREVTLFDDGNVPMSTSAWHRVGEAVASLLSLKVLPDDGSDKSTTISKWRNDTVEVQSFVLTQREMWAALQHATGTKEEDWTVKHVDATDRCNEGMTRMKGGDRKGFSWVMYTRGFYKDAPFKWIKCANELLGLKDEDVDTVTKQAVKMEQEGRFASAYD